MSSHAHLRSTSLTGAGHQQANGASSKKAKTVASSSKGKGKKKEKDDNGNKSSVGKGMDAIDAKDTDLVSEHGEEDSTEEIRKRKLDEHREDS